MKKLNLVIKGLLTIAVVVFLAQPALGYQMELDDFILGIEERPGYHNVKGLALSPNDTRLLVAHWQSGTVGVQDPIGIYSTDGHCLVDKIGVGGCVGGVAVSDDGCCAYGTSYYGGSIYSFDVCNGNTETIADLGSWANMLWKTPDGNRVIVSYNASSGSPSTQHSLALIDISGDNCSMSVLDTLNLGGPGGDKSAAFLPDSSMMYFVVDSNTTEGAGLLEISLENDTLVINRKIVLAGGANDSNAMAGVVLAGDTLYVGDKDGMKIHLVDRRSFEKIDEIDLSFAPGNIALHPDGRHLFLLYGTECGGVSVLDIQAESQVALIDCALGVPQSPAYIIFTRDGRKAYISHSDSATSEGGVSVWLLTSDIDSDGDGIPEGEDNCPNHPNGPAAGTCIYGAVGDACTSNEECDKKGGDGFCSMAQEDSYPPQGNGIGDACECEADFDCNGSVDSLDIRKFLEDFGRSPYNNPCPACARGF